MSLVSLLRRHNNHHAFPYSARHGLEWWQFDWTWYMIWALEKVGLAWDVMLPSEKAKASKAASKGAKVGAEEKASLVDGKPVIKMVADVTACKDK